MVHKVYIIPIGCLRMNCSNRISLRFFCLIVLIFILLSSQTFASGAELTNIVVKNDREDLLIDLTIQGVFTNEMKKKVSFCRLSLGV